MNTGRDLLKRIDAHGGNMDQCTNCTMRGNLQGCLATKCNQHENWMVRELRQILMDIKYEVEPYIQEVDKPTVAERQARTVYLIAMRGLVSPNAEVSGSPTDERTTEI